MRHSFIFTILFLLSGLFCASARDFFQIESVRFLNKAPMDDIGVWFLNKPQPPLFRPCIEVKVSVGENIRSDKTIAKAYFYGEGNQSIAVLVNPSNAGKLGDPFFSLPVLFYKDKPNRFFFELPKEAFKGKWKAVVVFGDQKEAQSVCYPPGQYTFLEYAEKKLVEDHKAKRITRKPDMDPLIEHVVKTRNPDVPQMTLFLRAPKGVSNAAEIKGVLAICVLAANIEEMRRQLSKEEMPGDYSGLFSFANQHKFAILAWGTSRLWNPSKNYDQLTRDEAKTTDKSMDTVVNAWERGVRELSYKYGIPDKDFLLWGSCASAQWASRLCLRKPEMFLAIHVHMPGSYDKPTLEASKVLWCLTIGELEGGYERSKRFVTACRSLGYPMLYKAIPGLGHDEHQDAKALGFAMFEYALTQKKSRDASGKISNSEPGKPLLPWPESFQHPPFYGDLLNQEVFPANQVDMIPLDFRISLPTKEIAEIWGRNK